MTRTTDEQKNELGKLAKDIAAYLGDGWKGSYQELYGWRDVALIVNDDRATLSVYPTPDGRATISGHYPDGYNPYRQQSKDITVALSRGTEVIAKEIKRRFLPEYLASYRDAVERSWRSYEFEVARTTAMSKLAAILHEPANGNTIHLSLPWSDDDKEPDSQWQHDSFYGKVSLTSEHYGELNINSAPFSLIATLLQTIANYAEGSTN